MQRASRLTWAWFVMAVVALAQAPVGEQPAESAPLVPATPPAVDVAETARRATPEAPPPGDDSVAIPISFRAPFSLNDCLNLLAFAASVLPEGENALQRIDRDSYLRLLESVSNYLKERDDLHASLVGYKWETIERARVRTGVIESLDLPFTGPDAPPGTTIPKGVTALSFIVERGDVLFHNMKVYDVEDQLIAEFRREQALVLRHSLPKREFFFLWQPTDVGRITLALSKASPADEVHPRILILAGRTNRPEHGKSAIWFLDGAHADIRAGRPEEARAKIRRAQAELRLFRDSVRRDR